MFPATTRMTASPARGHERLASRERQRWHVVQCDNDPVTEPCRMCDFFCTQTARRPRAARPRGSRACPGRRAPCVPVLPSMWACTPAEDALARSTSSSSARSDGHVEAVAHLAVHLDDELERVVHEQRRVVNRPGLFPQPLVAERRPQLLGQVRCVGLDSGLTADSAAKRASGSSGATAPTGSGAP